MTARLPFNKTLLRIISRCLLGLVAIICVLALFLSWLAFSQSGLRWLSERAMQFEPRLSIGSVSGRLLGKSIITDVSFDNNEISFSLDQLILRWQASQLFWSTLHVEQLSVDTLRIKQKQASSTESKNDSPPSISESIRTAVEALRLPIAIHLQELSVNGVEFLAYQAATPSKIERLYASLKSDSQKIQLTQFELLAEQNNNQLSVNGELQLGLTNTVASRGKLDWHLSGGSTLNPIKGQTIVKGNITALEVINSLASPYNSKLEITATDTLNNIQLSTTLHIDQLLLSAVNPEWPQHQITTRFNIAGDLEQLAIDGDSQVKLFHDDKPIRLQTEGQWQSNTLSLTVSGALASLAETISLQTTVKPSLLNSVQKEEENALNLELNWKNAQSNTKNNDGFVLLSPSGSLSLNGQPENYRFSLDALIEEKNNLSAVSKTSIEVNEPLNKGKIQLDGQGDREQVQLSEIRLNGPLGKVQGQGRIGFPPELTLDLSLQGRDIDPGLLASEWPGRLNFDTVITTEAINASQNATDQQIKGEVSVDGTLRSQALTMKAVFSHNTQISEIKGFELQAGASRINANARLQQQQLSGDWSIYSPDLNQLLPNAQGQLQSQGTFEQVAVQKTPIAQLEPIVKGTLSGADIAIAGTRVARIESAFDIDWRSSNRDQSSEINLDIDKLQTETQVIDSINASLKGNPAQHTIDGELKSDAIDAQMSLSGSVSENQAQRFNWVINAEEASIEMDELPTWRLAEASNIVLQNETQLIDRQCWTSEGSKQSNTPSETNATICFNAKREQERIAGEFSLANLLIDDYRTFFPDGLRWQQSQLSGSGTLNYAPDQALDLALNMDSSPGTLTWSDFNNETVTDPNTQKKNTSAELNFDTGQLRVNSDQGMIKGKLFLPLAADKTTQGFNGTFSIENSKKPLNERKLDGQLALQLDDLSPLTPLIPDASQLAGKIESQWSFSGTLKEPTLNGSLVMREGTLVLNSPGILVEDIDLKLQSQSAQVIQYQLKARSGGGNLSIDGDVDMNQSNPSTRLSIKGKDFQVVNTIDATAYASPDLDIIANADIIALTGSVLIPKANITPQELPESAVGVSEDQVIIDKENSGGTQANRDRLTANIDLILGDQVRIDSFGFKGKAQGELNINKEAQRQPLGNGSINISEGEYRAFGQGLVIEKGNIIYTSSPLDKPGIDIKALRRPAEGITVGVFAQGSVSQPELTIFSEPAMTQTEQLSWLVLGRSPEQSSEGENNAISQLLLSLTLDRGDTFLNSLSETFKLDTLSIQTGSGEAGAASDNDLAELVLGKYLSPDLYVSYGIGLFRPVNVLSLEYSLNKNWKLKSETSSEASGGDLIYTIER